MPTATVALDEKIGSVARSLLEEWIPDFPRLGDALLIVGELLAMVKTTGYLEEGEPVTISVESDDDLVRIILRYRKAPLLDTQSHKGGVSDSLEGALRVALIESFATRWGLERNQRERITWVELAHTPPDNGEGAEDWGV